MSLALAICILLVSLMQSINGAQLLNTTSLPTLFATAGMRATVIVPLTSI